MRGWELNSNSEYKVKFNKLVFENNHNLKSIFVITYFNFNYYFFKEL